jgi:hypothetical protein
MSDEPKSTKLEELAKKSFSVKIPRRLVWRNPDDSQYYVIERDSNSSTGWRYTDRRGYRHSTSCYAKLGRYTQQEMNQ